VPAEERTQVLDELTEAGLIDDARFARAWVNDRDRFSPRGAFLLRQELIKKGLSKEDITAALQQRTEREEEPVDELEQARALVAGSKMTLCIWQKSDGNCHIGSF
jgi:regulatory protein